MAPKQQAQRQLGLQKPTLWSTRRRLLSLPVLLLATAAISPISQLTLAPVYGAIPSSVNRGTMLILTCALGFMLKMVHKEPSPLVLPLLAVWAAWMPVIQSSILPFSGQLGPIRGPILNGFLSCHTLLIPSVYAVAETVEGLRKHDSMPRAAALAIAAGILALPTYLLEEKLPSFALEHWLPIPSFAVSPIDLQLTLGVVYASLQPSRLVLLGLPALALTALLNPHYNRASADLALRTHNWTLVARQWSNTGYISVLESFEHQHRVMRCDHSLLGGEWLLTDQRKKKEGWKVNEPIYAVFEMLEAVRLLQVTPAIPDTEARALVIGLGIGTAPKAFVAHGINTTTVELDPVVHDFATKFFGLPANHTSVLQDAVSWVAETAEVTRRDERKKYDYIIHDVFTGGAEPLVLFTTQFLADLRSLLSPNGVIALNYAGDLSVPLTRLVLRTILTTFSHQCKIYRDGPPETKAQHEQSDFLNLVVFCRNSRGPITFRAPTAADFLGSKSRQYYMLPKPEHEIPFPTAPAAEDPAATLSGGQRRPPSPVTRRISQTQPLTQVKHGETLYHAPATEPAPIPEKVLELGDVGEHAKQQAESAVRHWYIMRKVLPDVVWELW